MYQRDNLTNVKMLVWKVERTTQQGSTCQGKLLYVSVVGFLTYAMVLSVALISEFAQFNFAQKMTVLGVFLVFVVIRIYIHLPPVFFGDDKLPWRDIF